MAWPREKYCAKRFDETRGGETTGKGKRRSADEKDYFCDDRQRHNASKETLESHPFAHESVEGRQSGNGDRARQKENIPTLLAVKSGNGVGLHYFERETDMRSAINVRNGGGYVKFRHERLATNILRLQPQPSPLFLGTVPILNHFL